MKLEVVFTGIKPGELKPEERAELGERIGYAITSLQWTFDVEAAKPDADQEWLADQTGSVLIGSSEGRWEAGYDYAYEAKWPFLVHMNGPDWFGDNGSEIIRDEDGDLYHYM